MKKTIAILAAIILSGCTTVEQNGQVRTGVDLLSISSYKVRSWVPRTPVLRQVLAAGDYYVYAWKNTPWQTLIAHAGVLVAGEKLEWWDVIPELFDKEEEKPVLAAEPGAKVRVMVDGNGNSINYVYIPGQDAPGVDLSLTGDGNSISVGPMEEEEE